MSREEEISLAHAALRTCGSAFVFIRMHSTVDPEIPNPRCFIAYHLADLAHNLPRIASFVMCNETHGEDMDRFRKDLTRLQAAISAAEHDRLEISKNDGRWSIHEKHTQAA